MRITGLGKPEPKKDYVVIYVGVDDGGGLLTSERMTLTDAIEFRAKQQTITAIENPAMIVRKDGVF